MSDRPLEIAYTREGWIFSIKTRGEHADGIWMDYDDFLHDMSHLKNPGTRELFWRGRHVGRKAHPLTGEGFAIYYNSHNPIPFKKRIVLIGKIDRIEWDTAHRSAEREHCIIFSYRQDIVNALHKYPLYNTDENRDKFMQCGIKPGPSATFFFAPPEPWGWLLDQVRERLL